MRNGSAAGKIVHVRPSGAALAFISVAVAANAAAAEKPQYVDARLCAKCHRQIAEDYARTGMGRSFYRPAPNGAPTIQDFYHDLSDTHFAMLERGGQYFQRRWQIGFAGKEVNVEELRVDYVMGSGNHARSYLHRTDRGTLIELPFGWYAESGWGMSPGSDTTHPRTRRFVSYKCMFCHNGIPKIPTGNEAPGSDPVFVGELPEGIDCQRCHGPGSAHVQSMGTRATIVNPARLSAKLRMEICMQCHLETSSGRIPASIVRFNRGPFSYLPGEPLDAFMLTFDHAPGTGHEGKFEAVSSVYRLRQSKCFLQSEGKLSCDNCHNPHRAARRAEAIAQYATACLQCHTAHTESRDCAGCHMPKRRAEDTPGMVMTDHLIQRRPPPNLTASFRERPPEEYRGPVVAYYPSPLSRTPDSALYGGVAQVGLQNNAQAGLPILAREVVRQRPGDAEFYNVLGGGWLSAGKPQQAIDAYRQAVRLAPKSVSAFRSLAEAWAAAGQPARAAETFRAALEIAPSDPITWYRFGMFDSAGGRASEAVEKIRRALALDSSLPDLSRSLAEVLAKTGQRDAARAAVQDALRADPYDDVAWDISGRMLAEAGEMPEAYYDFERAIRLRPGHAPYYYDYALALIRGDRFDEAQTQAEASVRLDPNLADTHELLGGLFARKRELTDAAREYRKTIELRPDSSRVHLRLGNVLAAHGDVAAAAEHLRKAAAGNDEAVAQQAAQALRQMGVAR
jgi:predicted CXXCH cytochrome family protein